MIKIFLHIFLRDCWQMAVKSGAIFVQLGFLLVTASLFSFAVGADPLLLQQVSVAVVFVSLLLSSLLSHSKLFEEDFEDGSLQLLWMQSLPPELVVGAKFIAHWVANLIPMLCIVPLISAMFYMQEQWLAQMLLVLPLVMLLLTLIGGMGAALTLGLKRATGLLGLLIFPLYIPVLIFAVSAVSAVEAEVRGDALLMLFAMAAMMLPITVIASAFTIQKNLEAS